MKNSINSWIKSYRSKLDWEWYTNVPTAHLFDYILHKANFQEKEWNGIKIPRGCFITSQETMSKETGLTRQQIRTAISNLLATKEITKKSTKSYTLIKVEKWAEYQGMDDDTNQENNHQQTQNLTTTKEYKNNKEIYIDERVAKEFKDFEEMRKVMKKPLTPRAKELAVKKLQTMGDIETQRKVLEQSVVNCWIGLYPLKDKQKKEDSLPTYDNSKNSKMSQEEENELLALMGKDRLPTYDTSKNITRTKEELNSLISSLDD